MSVDHAPAAEAGGPARTPGWRLTGLALAGAGSALAAGGVWGDDLALWAAAPAWARWLGALSADTACQLGVLGAGLGLLAWWAARARWTAVVCWALCVLALTAPLRVPRLDRSSVGEPLRVLVYNALSTNGDTDGAVALIEGSGADVVALVEPSDELIDAFRAGGRLAGLYPSSSIPERAGAGFPVLAARAAMDQSRGAFGSAWEGLRDGAFAYGARGGVLEIGGVRVGVLLVQARSPRAPGRWLIGQEQAARAGEAAALLARELGGPVIVAGDLNATPTSARERVLRRGSGLVRAKPVWLGAGTWPSWSVWPARIAIDDVWATGGVCVESWRPIGSGGSDHCAVLVELRVGGGG